MEPPKRISCEISGPVLLNCWKHHAGFIRSKISEYREKGKFDFISIREELLTIGESLMDLYTGSLAPREIGKEIIFSLSRENVLEGDNFINWLNEKGNDYREIELSDKSLWTIRLGEVEKKHIHIHPSRYSVKTMRVKAVTLKSAIIYLILKTDNIDIQDDPGLINNIRKQYLNQPPLKVISAKSSLPRLVSVLR